MLTLAFDTCFQCCSAAVADASGRILSDLCEPMETGHAERLVPMLGEVLRSAGAGYGDVGRIAVTRGPGSFTGVRIGVAAARALALALNCPIVAATSLELLAAAVEPTAGVSGEPPPVVVAAVATRDGLLYVQALAGGRTVLEPSVLHPNDMALHLVGRDIVVAGTGAQLFMSALGRAGRSARLGPTDIQPSARDLARRAPTLPVANPLVPLYLRPPDAKPQAGAPT